MPAVALQGAVIIEQQKTSLKYKRKCEKCGWVENGYVSALIPGRGAKTSSQFYCPKCKNNQKVTIQGT